MKNYYDILQVSPSASVEVVDASWKALIRQCHPDLAGDDLAKQKACEARTRELNEAHDVLSDKKKRRSYDASLQFERTRPRAEDWLNTERTTVNPEAYPPAYPGVPHIRFEPKDIIEEFVTAADLPRAIENAFTQACQAVMAKVVKENPIIGTILEHGRNSKRKKSA